jgi:glycosyltransferase involved in cell wall biosynthesis
MISMKVRPSMLFVSNELRLPTETGSHVRISNLIRQYSEMYSVTLVTPGGIAKHSDVASEFIARHLSEVISVKQTQSSDRTRPSCLRYLLGPRGVLDFDPLPYLAAIGEIVARKGRFDVLHLERWYMTDIVKCDIGKRRWADKYVLDQDASDYNYRKQLAYSLEEGGFRKLKVCGEPWRVRIWEMRYLDKFDVVLVSSQKELEGIRLRTGCSNLVFIRNGYDVAETATQTVQSQEKALLFVGTLDYGPNLQGFEYICEHVLPRIRSKSPEAEFWHVGKCPKDLVERYTGTEGVRLLGFVDDISKVYSAASVVVAPIFQGAGTRIKILEAAAHGKGIVSTSFGAEDLDLVDGESIIIADSSEDMAAACLALLANAERASAIGQAARDVIAHKYGWSGIGCELRSAVSSVSGR